MISDSVVIELRESQATFHAQITDVNGNSKQENGNFEVICKNTPLYDGDEISIKSLYIDSVAASSEKIVIEKDLPLTLGCVNYIQNNDTANRSYNDSIFPDVPTNQPDCKAYFACNKSTILDKGSTMMVGEMVIYQQTRGKPWGRKGLFLKVLYTNLNDVDVFMNLPIPLNDGTLTQYNYNHDTYPNIFPLYCKGQVETIVQAIQPDNHTTFLPSDNINTSAIKAQSTTGTTRLYISVANASQFIELTGITMHPVVTDFGDFYGGTSCIFGALNWKTGIRQNYTINLPKTQVATTTFTDVTGVENGFSDIFIVSPSAPGLYQDAGFVQTSPSQGTMRETHNTQVLDYTDCSRHLGVVNFSQSFMYRQNEVVINMEAGNYTLEEICEKLTDKLTNIEVLGNSNFSNYPVNSPFLHTNNQLKQLNNITGTEVQYYCSEDGDSYFNMVNGSQDKWIGTDQVSFIGDPALNKAKISSIHANLYDSKTNVSTKFIKKGTAENYALVGRNGGIILTKLEPQSFFESIGFDFSPDVSPITQPQTVQNSIAGALSHLQKIDTSIGKHTTSAITGLSNAIIKNSFTDYNGMASMLVDQTTNANFEILGTNDISSITSNSGYFKISIDGLPSTTTNTKNDIQTNIQAIVGRYYQTASFTSAYSEASYNTIYKGVPTMLNKFRVKILNPDNSVVAGLGGNSAIFLVINRAQQPNKE